MDYENSIFYCGIVKIFDHQAFSMNILGALTLVTLNSSQTWRPSLANMFSRY